MALIMWIKRIYSIISSPVLATYLLFSLSLTLFLGYFFYTSASHNLENLDLLRLPYWIETYGRACLKDCWWFILALSILTGLFVNTLFCTAKHLRSISASLAKMGLGQRTVPLIKLLIHCIHISFIIIMAGYLLSYLYSDIQPSVILKPNDERTFSSLGLTLTLLGVEKVPYGGPNKLLVGRTTHVEALIKITTQGLEQKRMLYLNKAVIMGSVIFAIKKFSGNPRKEWIMLYVRRDPGLPLYLSGIFSLAISSYCYAIARIRYPSRSLEVRNV